MIKCHTVFLARTRFVLLANIDPPNIWRSFRIYTNALESEREKICEVDVSSSYQI
jgi:hypothetical protein